MLPAQTVFSVLLLLAGASAHFVAGADPTLIVKTPMPPPSWALMERELLKANSLACERFAEKYLDERGYLLHTPRWGTLDGPMMPSRPSTTGRYCMRSVVLTPYSSTINERRRATGGSMASCERN